MNYYEHHLGDYAEATAHLTFVEDAAYSRLIRKYYASEAPIPRDLKAAQRLVGARSKEEREAVETVLQEFFDLRDDGWHNGRCDSEIQRYQEKRSKAKRSAEARWNTDDRTADAMRTHSKSDANALPRQCEGNALQTPDTRHQAPEEETRATVIRPLAGSVPRETVDRIKAVYPPGTYRGNDWGLAEREIGHRLDEGERLEDLVAAAGAYAQQQQAIGKAGTQYVLKPSKFYGPGGDWRGPFNLPTSGADAEKALAKAQRDQAEERRDADLATRAKAIGFRARGSTEPIEAYETAVRLAERDRLPRQAAAPKFPVSAAAVLARGAS